MPYKEPPMDWSVMFTSRVVVFGCGNVLIGDDGAGPKIIELLREDSGVPDDVALIDAGTSIRGLLFDLITMDPKPTRIVIVDATTMHGKNPGEIFEIDVNAMDPVKVSDFTLHQFPTVNLLKQLREETNIEVKVVVIQTGYIPEGIMDETMSPEVEAALPELAQRVKALCLP
jgi:coenzyme F420 hydrogenase subunit delta